MARVSIHYDSDIKERLFMVRGDEAYARSTKIELVQGEVTETTYSFNTLFSVNVLRDVGESGIIIYDNDLPIPVMLYNSNTHSYDIETDIIPWSSLNNGLTFQVNGLAYGVDHNFTAKYIGNNSCSPSQSKIVTVNVQDTNRVESTLAITLTNYQKVHAEFIIYVDLSNEVNSSYNEGQTINLYYDGELIGTETTNSSGRAVMTVDDAGDLGLHYLTAEFDGSTNLLPSTKKEGVSAGFNVEIISCPSVHVNGDTFRVEATIKDWFGELYTPTGSESVKLVYNISDWGTSKDMTYSDGKYVVERTSRFLDDCEEIKVMFRRNSSESYSTSEISSFAFVNPLAPTISLNPSPFIKGRSSTITVQTNSTVENTPLHFLQGRPFSEARTIYTDSNGVASVGYAGEGFGNKIIQVYYGDLYDYMDAPDYIQYWADQQLNEGMYYTNGNLLTLTNYFRLDKNDASALRFGLLDTPRRNFDFVAELQGVYSNKMVQPGVAAYDGINTSPRATSSTLMNLSNTTLTITREGESLSLSKDGTTLVSTTVSGVVFPMFSFIQVNSGLQVSFKKLTFEEL